MQPHHPMDQLLSMGFSEEIASQAIAATGGKSAIEAAEWILSQQNTSQAQSPTTTTQQQSINNFFRPKSKSQIPRNPNSDPNSNPKRRISAAPLAERMRPDTVDLMVGQDHILGQTSIIKSEYIPSIVLWGPPGSGKTSLARAIAKDNTNYAFLPLSAVTAGVKELREAVETARKIRAVGRRTLLFVDEIHRFSKAQQDSFLPAIEDGSIVLIGATTENPSFQLTTPLLSRCRVLALKPLKPQDVETLLRRAAADTENGLMVTARMNVCVKDEVFEFLSNQCDGDARVALNALEIAATLAANKRKLGDDDMELKAVIEIEHAKEAMQCKHLAYDRAGDEHYNLISALHKSMRGSDADAAIYWLVRMLEGGEQPLYIARRLVRFASEDVGLADPAALSQAVACYQACHFLGMPECDVCLAQCVAYLALAPKSVAVYKALGEAKRAVKESAGGNEGVPLHLRNAPTKLMKEMGYGKDYLYPPDHDDCSAQTYLPPSLQGHKFLNWTSKAKSSCEI